jgi:HD-like signal output (HDOD) protein
MAISEAMLAQALLEYFQQHEEEFGEFLLERWNLDDGYVIWREDTRNRRLNVRVRILSQGGGIKAEDDYFIRIER